VRTWRMRSKCSLHWLHKTADSLCANVESVVSGSQSGATQQRVAGTQLVLPAEHAKVGVVAPEDGVRPNGAAGAARKNSTRVPDPHRHCRWCNSPCGRCSGAELGHQGHLRSTISNPDRAGDLPGPAPAPPHLSRTAPLPSRDTPDDAAQPGRPSDGTKRSRSTRSISTPRSLRVLTCMEAMRPGGAGCTSMLR
jgi:hypothetical protein